MTDNSSNSSSGLGNTKTKPLQGKIAKSWCFTIFNYDINYISSIVPVLQDKCKKFIIGQEICPTTGKHHLQCYCHFKNKLRITSIQTIFNDKTMHCEIAKGDDEQNYKYCSKELILYEHGYPIPIKTLSTLYVWQQWIIDNVITKPVDERAIFWFTDEIGNVGKSSFTKYLYLKYKAIVLSNGKKSDLLNIIYSQSVSLSNSNNSSVVIDIPRSEYNNCSYQAIEDIKNGLIINTKYETGMLAFNSPHLIIFSNFYPETHNLSNDRWHIYTINNKNECPIRWAP